MRKLLGTCLLITLLSSAAIWGVQRIGFFPRVLGAFSSMISGESVSSHARPAQDTQVAQTSPESSRPGQRPNGHAMPSLVETWKNVFAYVVVFAFVVMVTYYSEQGACALAAPQKRREERQNK